MTQLPSSHQVQWSEDGRFWWDGSRWVPAATDASHNPLPIGPAKPMTQPPHPAFKAGFYGALGVMAAILVVSIIPALLAIVGSAANHH